MRKRGEYSLKELFDIIMRKSVSIFVFTTIFGIGSFFFSSYCIQPIYSATVSFYVNNSIHSENNITNINDINASQKLVNTYVEMLKSNSILEKVADIASGNYSVNEIRNMMKISIVKDTEIFKVTIRNSNSQYAKDIANQMANIAVYQISDIVGASSVKIIDWAQTPQKADYPNNIFNTVVGILIGILTSILFAIVIDFSDIKVKGEVDLMRQYELPLLGTIPTIQNTSRARVKTVKRRLRS